MVSQASDLAPEESDCDWNKNYGGKRGTIEDQCVPWETPWLAETECYMSQNLQNLRDSSLPARSAMASCHTRASGIYMAGGVGI